MNGFDFYIGSLRFSVEPSGIIISAFAAALITFLIIGFLQIRRFAKDANIIVSGFYQMKNIMERCYRLFPIETVVYHGITFKRGMSVKITLSDSKSFIGRFVGLNVDDMVCVVTQKSIIAQEINLIKDLVPAEKPAVEGAEQP